MANGALKNKLAKLKDSGFFKNLTIMRGIEKEFFRINKNGYISKNFHPESLGSALTNRYITTDFAEAQVELVTPTFENINDLNDFLYSLHSYVAKNIDSNELLWPYSMPPEIKHESDINIGVYHQSNVGLLKHVYRRGLKVRYGSTMQCVSGMHYNFSLKPASLYLLTNSNSQKSFDEAYLGLIRNFKRIFWFVLLEFGQTNVVNKSFVKGRKHILNKLNENDMYLENATSLRMSDIGYQSKAQKNLNIKYNSLSEFLNKIKKAMTVPFPEFEKQGLKDSNNEYQQISNGIIQIENEYYDSIRPKRSQLKNHRPYDLLKEFGIEYLEIRGIDISPNDISGISLDQIQFLDLLLIYCLISPSPKITSKEKQEIDNNDSKAIYEGRNENTEISLNGKNINICTAENEIIEGLRTLASYFNDCEKYLESIDNVLSMEKGKIPKENFHNDGLALGKVNTNILRSGNPKYIDSIKKEAELSLNKLKEIPENTNEEMNEFVKNYNLKL